MINHYIDLASMYSVNTYIHRHIAVAGEFPPGGCPVNWETNTEGSNGVVPDASSVLRRAWWNILKQEFNERRDLGLPLHPKEQGWIDDSSSQKEVQATAVSRDRGGCCLLQLLIGKLQKFKETVWRKRWGYWQQCWTTQCCRNSESLYLLGLVNSSTSTTQSWFAPLEFLLFPRTEKHHRGQHFHSSEDVQKEV